MYLLIVGAAMTALVAPVVVLVFSTDPHRNRDESSPLKSFDTFDGDRIGMAPLDLSAMDVTASMITQSGVMPANCTMIVPHTFLCGA